MKIGRKKLLGIILAVILIASVVVVIQPAFGQLVELAKMPAVPIWEKPLPPELRAAIYETVIVPGTNQIVATSPHAIWKSDERGNLEQVVRLSTGKRLGESATLAAGGTRAGIITNDHHDAIGFKLISLEGKVLAEVASPVNFHYRIAPMGDSFTGIDAGGEHIPVTAEKFRYTFYDKLGIVISKEVVS